jgi:hypothetical protein
MPDIVASRPIAGQPIETAWGQQLHDAVEGIQTGQATITNAGAAAGSTPVVFPVPFAGIPRVVGMPTGASTVFACTASLVTTDGFTFAAIRVDAGTAGTIVCDWIAIGPMA